MDDKNSSNVQHPLHAALMIFHATVRTAFETAAAFWRPWFREPEKKDVAAREQSKAASEEAPQPTKREQEATEKKPKAPTKRSLKDEQELEREDRAQKTERLRKLRLAKEAADREKNPSSNGRDEAQHE
jgi:leucyl aminopeptidase (aminopeptidase T)